MKKIILSLLIFVSLTANIFSQVNYIKFGATKIKDSTGYTTFNRPAMFYQDIFAKTQIKFDSLAKGRIYYDGFTMNLYNEKNNGDITLWIGGKESKLTLNKLTDVFPGYLPLIFFDSTGIDLLDASMEYKINGVAIGGSSVNLFGYGHKDTAFTYNEHVRIPSFALYRKSSPADSVEINIKNGSMIITPTSSSVTFGSSTGTGTKDIYAGAYYIGSTNLFANTNTWTASNTFNVGDSAIIVHTIKGLTGQTTLTIKSPGDGGQKLVLENTLNSESISLQTKNGYSLGLSSVGVTVNDARMNWSTSSFGFGTDADTYYKRDAADDVGFYTGGTERLDIKNAAITSSVPLIITGSSSYFKHVNLSALQIGALTPSAGMVVFNTGTNKLQVYDGSTWVDLH